jgi:hypothetical protein
MIHRRAHLAALDQPHHLVEPRLLTREQHGDPDQDLARAAASRRLALRRDLILRTAV